MKPIDTWTDLNSKTSSVITRSDWIVGRCSKLSKFHLVLYFDDVIVWCLLLSGYKPSLVFSKSHTAQGRSEINCTKFLQCTISVVTAPCGLVWFKWIWYEVAMKWLAQKCAIQFEWHWTVLRSILPTTCTDWPGGVVRMWADWYGWIQT